MSLDLSERIHYHDADLTVLAAIDRADLLRMHIVLLAGLRVQSTGKAELNRRIGSQYKRWLAAMADARVILKGSRPFYVDQLKDEVSINAVTCQLCGTTFCSKRSDGKYCSSKCRQKSYRQRK